MHKREPILEKDAQNMKESEKRDKYQDFAWELKNYKTWKWRWNQL